MTTDRRTPDAAPELTDEFWGEQAEWTAQRPPRRGLGPTIGRWWDHLLGSGVAAERVHGEPDTSLVVDPDRVPDRDASAEDARDLDVDDWAFEPEPRPERGGGVDPLLARFGLLAVILTLASPIVLGFTASGDDTSPAASGLVVEGTPGSSIVDSAATLAGTDEQPTASADSSPAARTPSTAEAAERAVPEAASGNLADEEAESSIASTLPQSLEPARKESAAALSAPACGGRYELAAGDYWIRLADAAGVALSELLAVNDASVDTVLVPGRSICLPVGASTPAPPATVAPASPTKPAPSRPAPTTLPPAPAPPSRPSAIPQSQAVQVIRDVWPDDLEVRAIEIAWRESNHRSNVSNSCCYGLFQIHWQAHRSWLSTMGVTSVTQLYDPTVNATVAYALYQRAGGFGPWGG